MPLARYMWPRALSAVGTAMLQVYINVETAVTPLTAEEKDVLAGVQNILAPIHNVTWPSGRPENN